MMGCGIVAATVLSFIYAFVDYWNPFVYVTVVATGLFGLGVGIAINIGATLGKVRNPLYARLVGVVMGLLSLYLCWAFYLYAVLKADPELCLIVGLQQPEFFFDPLRMYALIQWIAENGLWGMFGGTPTGWALYGLWFVEAAIIFIATVVVASGNESPFCEPCNAWTDDADNLLQLENTDFEEFRRDLEDERYERIDELHTGQHDAKDCMRVTLHTCPKCDESNFMTIKHVEVTLDNDGDESEDETDVVKRLMIPAELVTHLKAAASNPPVKKKAKPQAEDIEDFDEPDFDEAT
jgi:hypothetical protein